MADPNKSQLEEGRDRLAQLLAGIETYPAFRSMWLTAALFQARTLDEHGDQDDTRRLAGVLSARMDHASQDGDEQALTLAAAELLAVLADLADWGDEDMAINLNGVVPGLNRMVVGYGKAWSRQRRTNRQALAG